MRCVLVRCASCVVGCSLLGVVYLYGCCSLCAVRCLLLGGCFAIVPCVLLVKCSLFVVRCSLLVVSCLLCVVCYACSSLFAVAVL